MTKKQAKPQAEKIAAAKVRSLDDICAKIADGKTYTAIAEDEGISKGSLSEWLEATSERSARARAARILAARIWDEKALQTIQEAGDPFALAKAREEAQHYRWRASKIAPEYSDKVAHGGAADMPPIKTESTVTYTAEEAYKRMLAGG